MDELRDDKPLWGVGEVLKLALPTAAGMVNATIMQFVDGLMVSRLIGPQALGAQFVGGIISFVPVSLAMGTLSVVNTYVAQNLGAGRLNRCGQYTWQGLHLALAMGLLLLPVALLSGSLFQAIAQLVVRMGGAPTAPEVLAMQAVYFRYLTAGAALTLMARVMEQYFYGTHRPIVVFFVSVLAVGLNAVLDWVLIKGVWIFPAMGIEGAALATLIAWAVSFLLPLAIFLSRKDHARFATRNTWRFNRGEAADILRIGWPSGVQFANDVLSWGVFVSVLVAYFGEVHKAASAAVMRYLHISFMPAVGVGIAATALVGRYIGEGRPDLARRRTHAALAISIGYMGLCGLCFFLFRFRLLEVFVPAPQPGEFATAADYARRLAEYTEIMRIGGWVMICAAVFQCFDAVGIVFIGALRGAGDTLWPMLVTVGLSYGVTVGGGLAAVKWLPQLTSIGPWMAGSLYVVLLGIAVAWRFEGGAWRKIDLLGRGR